MSEAEAHLSPSSPQKMMHHHHDGEPHKSTMLHHRVHPSHRLALFALLLLLLLAGLIALILYLVYRPSHPRFSVTSAAVYSLSKANATVSSTMQFTLLVRNPNRRSSVTYNRVAAYATYRGQAITPPAPLPLLYQEPDSSASVSPVLGGAPLPVSADVGTGLARDKAYGVVALRLVVVSHLRFKSGPFYGGWRSMNVRCDVLVSLKSGLLGTKACDVDI